MELMELKPMAFVTLWGESKMSIVIRIQYQHRRVHWGRKETENTNTEIIFVTGYLISETVIPYETCIYIRIRKKTMSRSLVQ